MTREEHLKWCKERALAYLPHDPREAITSMMSDIRKHPETNSETLMSLGIMTLMNCNAISAREYITGFN